MASPGTKEDKKTRFRSLPRSTDTSPSPPSPVNKGPPVAPIEISSIPEDVMKRVHDRKVKDVAILHGDKTKVVADDTKFGTSKIHHFARPASISDALNWLHEKNAEDATLVFENESSLTFLGSKFSAFDDMDDK